MKTALFDLDGTLTDTRDDLTLAVNLTRADYNLPPITRDAVVAQVGNGVKALIDGIFDPLPESYELIINRYKAHYAAHLLVHTTLYPGVEHTLKTLHAAGWHLGVVTNKPSQFAAPILEGLGVAQLFSAVVGGGDCKLLKPDPASLLLAAERMGVVLDATDWMIGDHVTDLEAGRRAGLRTCFCEFGMGESRDVPYDAGIGRMDEFLLHINSYARTSRASLLRRDREA
ncbi:MAG: HAD-IA family hydrolase [Kiritimatiellae bacterium]|nr:HAD-IA family hydrolase [Kiritimatiellia bacterium]